MRPEVRPEVPPRVRARCVALIPAAGTGSRASADLPKQYLEVAGKPMIVRTIEAFAAVPAIARIVVVIARDDAHFEDLRFDDASAGLIRVERAGGATRDASVLNGLDALRHPVDAAADTAADDAIDDDDWILVHDAARCGITPAMIESLIETLRDDDVGGLLALPVADTIKRASGSTANRASERASVVETVARSSLWQAQTPQMFRYRLLRDALADAQRKGLSITDEASAIEAAGYRPGLVMGAARNFKVTTADDLAMMDALLRAPLRAALPAPLPAPSRDDKSESR